MGRCHAHQISEWYITALRGLVFAAIPASMYPLQPNSSPNPGISVVAMMAVTGTVRAGPGASGQKRNPDLISISVGTSQRKNESPMTAPYCARVPRFHPAPENPSRKIYRPAM
jgi:hypothetical protein